jgi:hypothetical protein
MVQAMHHEAVKRAMDGASDGKSDRRYKRWITKQLKELSKERWMVPIIVYIIGSDSKSARL